MDFINKPLVDRQVPRVICPHSQADHSHLWSGGYSSLLLKICVIDLSARPSMLNMKARKKFDSWSAVAHLPLVEAMRQYMSKAGELGWQYSQGTARKTVASSGFGIVPSRPVVSAGRGSAIRIFVEERRGQHDRAGRRNGQQSMVSCRDRG